MSEIAAYKNNNKPPPSGFILPNKQLGMNSQTQSDKHTHTRLDMLSDRPRSIAKDSLFTFIHKSNCGELHETTSKGVMTKLLSAVTRIRKFRMTWRIL